MAGNDVRDYLINAVPRDVKYRRKRDDAIVSAADWADGDVSWMLVRPPLVWFGNIAGTCKRATFEKNHEVYRDAR